MTKAILKVTLIALIGLTYACAQQAEKKTVSEVELQKVIEQQTEMTSTPDFVDAALLLDGISGTKLDRVEERRFDVSVTNMPAKTFFLNLIAEHGVNVVTHPEVKGNITLDLSSVTVAEVLDVVRDVYGYEFRHNSNIYTIYPKKLRTEIFTINYIDVSREGKTDTNVSIGSGQQNRQSGNADSGNKNSNSNSGGTNSNTGARVQTTTKTDFWQLLEKTVSSMVSAPNDGRSVLVNPQAGLVVVTAMPNEIHAVRLFLERSELSVKRQVVLEAKIVEVRLNSGFEAGIDWNSIQGELQYSNNVTSYGGVEILEATANGPEVFSSILKIFDVRDFLSLLESQGSVQVLSSPRVSTVNNQKAVIRVGSDEFFVTGVKNNTTASAASTVSSPELELTSFFSGISLDVTPQISSSGDVILHIHPIVSEVNDQVKEVTVGDSKFSLPLALRDIRESDSIVRARSGQVIVLGGLMQESSQHRNEQKPWLGKIPLVNAFFKRKVKGQTKTELVILLRPIVVQDDTWQSQLDDYQRSSRIMGDRLRGQ